VCPITSIREEQLEDAVRTAFETLRLSEAEVNEMRDWIANRRLQATNECNEQKRAATLQLEALRLRLSRLTDLLLDGSVEKTVYEEKRRALVWEETELQQKLRMLDAGRDQVLQRIEETVELAKDAPLLYQQANLENKRELLRILLSNLTVSGKNVSAVLHIPFQVIAEREKTSHGAPYRGTCRTLGVILEQLHKCITKTSAGVDARP
jgi:FtsZ-binding cell division protein ZapB